MVPEGVPGNSKSLAILLCVTLQKSNLGLLWNYQKDKELPTKETEAKNVRLLVA